MKIFIWEEVLHEWTDGMAIAYAENLEEALAQFSKIAQGVSKELGAPTKIIDCEKDKEPFVAFVYGGM